MSATDAADVPAATRLHRANREPRSRPVRSAARPCRRSGVSICLLRAIIVASVLLGTPPALAAHGFPLPPPAATPAAGDAAQDKTEARAAALAMEGQARAVRNDFTGAYEAFSKAIALTRSDERRAMYFIFRGYLAGLGPHGHTDQAIADITEGMRDPVWRPVAYGLRARVWLERKDYDRAIADCTEQLRLLTKPGDNPGEGLRVCGLAWLGKKDFAKAIDHFDRALARNPNLAEAMVDRGIAFAMQGQDERALADYGAALRQNPKNALALYARGVTRLERGDAAGNADIAAAKAVDSAVARKFDAIAGR